MEAKTLEEKRALLNDLEGKDINFSAFILGFDVDIEKAIIKYINHSGSIVTFSELVNKFVYEENICSKGRLLKRVESLINHGFLVKTIKVISYGKNYRNIVLYILKME